MPPRCSYIQADTVRAALDTLLYSASEHPPSSLENLLLVDLAVARPELPASPDNREYALHEILTTLITQELAKHRRAFDRQPPEVQEQLFAARITIAADAQTSNPELIGWSWLYYRYVRVDLALSPGTYCEAAHFDERTLRRYQQHTIRRLAKRLLDEERKARREHFQRRLVAALPTPAPAQLIGRSRELALARQLVAGPPPHHLLVTGSAGIGKTMFIQEAVRQQIEAGNLDYVVWIDEPASVPDIQERLSAALQLETAAFSLRDHAAQYDVALVLDNVESLYDQIGTLERLLDDLSTEQVFIINRNYLPLRNIYNHIVLPELPQPEALALIRLLANGHHHTDDSEITNEMMLAIWEQVGGNPATVKRALHNLELN